MRAKCGVILSGFTMIEMLFALLVMTLLMPLLVNSTRILMFDQSVQVSEMEDMMGLEQLRLYLGLGNITLVEQDCLHYVTNEEYTLTLVNGNLTLRPGNLVFLTDIKSIIFYEELTSVCMKYRKLGKWYDVWIGYPQGIY